MKKLQLFLSLLATSNFVIFKIFCSFLSGGISQCILYVQRHFSIYEIIENFSVQPFRKFVVLGSLKSGSVQDFKTVSLSFLITSATYFL